MMHINLLPYRQARRQKRILNHLVSFLVVIVGALILMAGVQIYYSEILTARQQTSASLQAKNRLLVKKIGKIRNFDKLKSDVESKLELVDRLQLSRFRSLGRLIALSSVIPKKVWLQSIIDSGSIIKLTGFGESNKAVANFMRSIEHDPLFSNVRLEVIQRVKAGDVPVREFILSLTPLGKSLDKASLQGVAS